MLLTWAKRLFFFLLGTPIAFHFFICIMYKHQISKWNVYSQPELLETTPIDSSKYQEYSFSVGNVKFPWQNAPKHPVLKNSYNIENYVFFRLADSVLNHSRKKSFLYPEHPINKISDEEYLASIVNSHPDDISFFNWPVDNIISFYFLGLKALFFADANKIYISSYAGNVFCLWSRQEPEKPPVYKFLVPKDGKFLEIWVRFQQPNSAVDLKGIASEVAAGLFEP